MRIANIFVNGINAAQLKEFDNKTYQLTYLEEYAGYPISLTMPLTVKSYTFDKFPPFFEGLLPEGVMLEALLRKYKLDKQDFFGQLLQVGSDVVGAITIKEAK